MNHLKLKQLLKKIALFEQLDDQAIVNYFDFFEHVHLKENEALFNQGDNSYYMCIVTQGKLRAEFIGIEDDKKLIGYINAEETVGELGVFSGEVRSLTVTADEPSSLLKISAENFHKICTEHASVMAKMMPQLVKRSQGVISLLTEKEHNRYAVIVPGTNEINLKKVINQVSRMVENSPYITCSSINEPANNSSNVPKKRLYAFEQLDSSLFSFNYESGGDFYIFCDASKSTDIDIRLLSFLSNLKKCNLYLVLMHGHSVKVPIHTSMWLSLCDFEQHYHIKPESDLDIKRLLRFIIKKPIGLVLGGGGMKGWVHLGVLKLLDELNIPIDYFGGTSIGASIGCSYGISLNYEETLNKINEFVRLLTLGVKWRDLTWPVISLYSGNNFTKAHKELFQAVKLEDLWLPGFCISANLSKQREKIHRRGDLWKISRASTSLPGLLPPVMFDGDIHVDGGVLNNLPTDIMRSLTGDQSLIIACDLQEQMESTSMKFEFDPIVHLLDIILMKFGMRKQIYSFPSYSETVLQSLMLGSSMRNQNNTFIADVLINPDLFGYKMASIKKGQKEELMEKGYNMARERLNSIYHKKIKPLLFE